MDASSETINIILLLKISKPYTSGSDPQDSDASIPNGRDRRYEQYSDALGIVRSGKIINPYLAIRDTTA